MLDTELLRKILTKQFWKDIEDGFTERFRAIGNALDVPTAGLFMRVWHAIDRFAKYGPHEAAALSYYALFSLFPLVLLIIVFSTSFLDGAETRESLADVISLFFPGDTAQVLTDAVESTQASRSSVTIFSFVLLGWSSSSLFGNLEKVLNLTFGLDVSRKIYERRFIGFIMIFMLAIFLFASLLTNVIFSFLGLLFLNSFNVWLQMASLFVPTAFNAAIFTMLYGFLPRHHLRWDAILPVSLIAGGAFEIGKWFFVWYLQNLSSLDYVYGSVTTVVVFLLWMFYTFCLLLLGAEISVAVDDWMERPLQTVREDTRPPALLTEGQFARNFFSNSNSDSDK